MHPALTSQIINSLEKGRLADAALFATSVRPSDVEQTEPILSSDSPGTELQVHKAAFFFRLERELEKINTFYLQKESELRSRLTTLISKKRHLVALATHAASDGTHTMRLTRDTPSLVALLEGFRYFEKDLAKLQQFIEINATGFRKILKKWDKRFKSQTKELYLARQVEVQRTYRSLTKACFNREFIAEMSDIASASILQLESLADGHPLPVTQFKGETALLRGSLPSTATNLPNSMLLADGDDAVEGLVFDSERPLDFEAARKSDAKDQAMAQLEEQVSAAVREGRIADTRQLLEQARTQAAELELSDEAAPVHSGMMHQLWRALVSAPSEAVQAAIDADLPDYQFVDDINARTALHISTLAGQLELARACIAHGVDSRRCDVYGREALAYAAMHGLEDLCEYLLSLPESQKHSDEIINQVDMDGFSVLVHAIVRGHTRIVRALLDFAQRTNTELRGKTEFSDLSPLAIAAQRGHVDITRLLLERGAKSEVNAEGLWPQTLAARAGHTECLRLLIAAKADVNAVEKGTQCTPLFYAAEYGHAACVDMLLAAGASIDHVDEKGRHALFYAAWHGWRECTQMLLAAHRAREAASAPAPPSTNASHAAPDTVAPADADADADADLDLELDGIPSLHLPPPIIPFRTYGHNYLDKRTLLCLSLTNNSILLHRATGGERPEMGGGLLSSLKLVLTPRQANGGVQAGIPHTLILPLADDREEVTFQIADMESFYLELELFPTFGSARIAKTVLLPDVLNHLQNRTQLPLPLFDWHLNAVGHMNVVVESVCPYGTVQLQIGGRVETYWKSTLPSNNQPLTISPPSQGAAAHDTHDTASYVTASSLSGNYLRAQVRFTKDTVPVVCATNRLPIDVWAPLVSQVTAAELATIALRTGHEWHVSDADAGRSMSEWSTKLRGALVTLETLLSTLPLHIGLAIEVVLDEPDTAPINACIDATLHAVYDAAGREKKSRRLFFSSAVPSACVALNWKQPNYAVFFVNHATLDADAAVSALPSDADPRQSSVAEAVRFAKGNNLLGVMLDTPLLESVPELIPAIKAASLVLITLSRPSPSMSLSSSLGGAPPLLGPPALPCQDLFDGFLDEDVVECIK